MHDKLRELSRTMGGAHAAAPAPSATFTFHARKRQLQRGIPTCLVLLALAKGSRVDLVDRVRFVLGAEQIAAAGLGPVQGSVGVVVVEDRVVTVFWVELAAGRCA